MLPEPLLAPVRALLCVCVAASAMETAFGDERTPASFHSLCALAVALCAVRLAVRTIKLWVP